MASLTQPSTPDAPNRPPEQPGTWDDACFLPRRPLPLASGGHAKPDLLVIQGPPDIARALARTLRGFDIAHLPSAHAAYTWFAAGRAPRVTLLADDLPDDSALDLLMWLRPRLPKLPIFALLNGPDVRGWIQADALLLQPLSPGAIRLLQRALTPVTSPGR